MMTTNDQLNQMVAQTQELINSLIEGKGIKKSFRRQLLEAMESGQTIPVVQLSEGSNLNNVTVSMVGIDFVAFTAAGFDNTAIVRLKDIVSIGTL